MGSLKVEEDNGMLSEGRWEGVRGGRKGCWGKNIYSTFLSAELNV